MNDWMMIVLTVVSAFLTLVIAILTYLVWRAYLRIEWFTGSMESHSACMLRIEAKRGIKDKPTKLVWWDKTIAPPPIKREHGQEIDLETIYMGIPLRERKNKATWWASFKNQVQ